MHLLSSPWLWDHPIYSQTDNPQLGTNIFEYWYVYHNADACTNECIAHIYIILFPDAFLRAKCWC